MADATPWAPRFRARDEIRQTLIRITDIIDRVLEYNPEANLDIIDQAYIYSARVHDGQMRLSGEPYLSHPLEVAGILADMNLDSTSIAAGLLHDVVEDTHATEEEIEDMFGAEVRQIVAGVTKLSVLPVRSSQARQAESLRKMLLAMANDVRVILIKLADRLHNMRTLVYQKENKRRKIARETLDIYAPIASRLGIYWLKHELEGLCFPTLYPEEYAEIKQRVAKDRAERDQYITRVKAMIRDKMSRHNLPCEVLGRHKRYYSIYQKMLTQNLEFEDVYDIIAFRVILDTVSQCYEALGIVHALWKPVDQKFKDYIGRPKPNMYQSLHTTVIGPKGERMEIQIRTGEMDRVAQSGIAAHWSYKEGRSLDQVGSDRFSWIQDLVENLQSIRDPEEFLENVRIDLFPDEVYVFTPNGEIKSLPRGATPVDFAYTIHTEVGHRCNGAKVNGRIVPLTYELQTGDLVSIITLKEPRPSKDWLNFVKTVKARNRIRQWIRVQERDRSITLGREMCEKAFRKHRLNFNTLVKSEQMEEVVALFGFKNVDDLIANVGYGKITPLQLVHKLEAPPEAEEETLEAIADQLREPRKHRRATDGVMVRGVGDLLVRFGKCCKPLPGDSIVGYITRGQGVSVHRKNCINIQKMSPERLIEVQWDRGTEETYPVRIRISSYDRMGLLADVTACISKNGANIISVNSITRENKMVDSYFTLSVKDTEQLRQVLAAIKKVKRIMEVKRLDG